MSTTLMVTGQAVGPQVKRHLDKLLLVQLTELKELSL